MQSVHDQTHVMQSCSDTDLLADAMSCINERPHALLVSNLHHLLPRHEYARVGSDRINNGDNLVLLRPGVCEEAGGGRGDVGELRVRILLLDSAKLRAKEVEYLGVSERELVSDGVYGRTRLLGAVSEVAGGVDGRRVCCRSCDVCNVSIAGLSRQPKTRRLYLIR